MSKLERVNVAVSADIAALLHEAVATGEFASTDEVLQAALEEWSGNRLSSGEAADRLGKLWDEGLASGPPRDAEASFARIKENLRAKLEPEGD